eukprot:1157234-Pelagomonas_calceolata.AAC.8
MATALQSATIHLPPQTGKAATYAWAPARSQLYAAGARACCVCVSVCVCASMCPWIIMLLLFKLKYSESKATKINAAGYEGN